MNFKRTYKSSFKREPVETSEGTLKKILSLTAVVIVLIFAVTLSLPTILIMMVKHEQAPAIKQPQVVAEQFPVTVDPRHKKIIEDSMVNSYYDSKVKQQQAAVGANDGFFRSLFDSLATSISNSSWYSAIASVGGTQTFTKIITIGPGLRKEQIADTFAQALGWNDTQKLAFSTPEKANALPYAEGSYFPSIYTVDSKTTPAQAQALVNERFTHEVLNHYGTTTAAIVPVNEALTIASLIQRETIGNKDMRMVSGIIWNRLFANMNLQLDASLQYAEANSKTHTSWWPSVEPEDKYIKSPFNTYLNNGLPPTPIANPSVAAILAALNPSKTSCLFYFNDRSGGFHCSATYKEHKDLIQKYYWN